MFCTGEQSSGDLTFRPHLSCRLWLIVLQIVADEGELFYTEHGDGSFEADNEGEPGGFGGEEESKIER